VVFLFFFFPNKAKIKFGNILYSSYSFRGEDWPLRVDLVVNSVFNKYKNFGESSVFIKKIIFITDRQKSLCALDGKIIHIKYEDSEKFMFSLHNTLIMLLDASGAQRS
jgi:hypothetical protein